MVAPTTVQGQPEPGHANALDSVTTDRLQSFFERDNNSRLTSGKKQTVTKNKLKKQKCLLLDTAVNLHQKFCAENIYISLCTLCSICKTVYLPTSKDRDTCMCKRHSNVQLMSDKLTPRDSEVLPTCPPSTTVHAKSAPKTMLVGIAVSQLTLQPLICFTYK